MTDDLMKIYVYRNPDPAFDPLNSSPLDLIKGRLYIAHTGSDAAPPNIDQYEPVAYGWTPRQAMRRAQRTMRCQLTAPTPVLVELVTIGGAPAPRVRKPIFQIKSP